MTRTSQPSSASVAPRISFILILALCCLMQIFSKQLFAQEAIRLFPGGIVEEQVSADTAMILTIALPGIGGRSDRSLFLQSQMSQGRQWGRVQLRSWQFQERLQPSHIRRLERIVEHSELILVDDQISGTLALRLRAPRQLGNPAVDWLYRLEVQAQLLEDADPPQLRSDFSTPPWRRVDMVLHGKIYRGQVRGVKTDASGASEPLDGEAWMSLQPPPAPRCWSSGKW